eukprot:2485167-Amphidinium_carterae.1
MKYRCMVDDATWQDITEHVVRTAASVLRMNCLDRTSDSRCAAGRRSCTKWTGLLRVGGARD